MVPIVDLPEPKGGRIGVTAHVVIAQALQHPGLLGAPEGAL